MLRILGVVILIVSLLGGWLWMAFDSATYSALALDTPISFQIRKGESFNRVTQTLTDKGVLKQPFYFKILGKIENATNRLKAGEYRVVPGITARDLLTMMVDGKVHQYSVSFIEGCTFKRMRKVLEETPRLNHVLQGKTDKEIMRLVGASGRHPEGLFFPDTYFFTRDTEDVAILKRAFRNMESVLSSEWNNRAEDLPFRTPYEALILASIVEKETAQSGERSIIAGVFVRRLHKGMLLQTDPAIIYGMGERFKGNLRLKDLQADTPYNTYTRRGLPPTPIAMPGIAAIRAVLHPQSGNSLYFVARGDGTHVFSATLREHNRAVNNFQKKRGRD